MGSARIAQGSHQDKWLRFTLDVAEMGQANQPTNEVQSLTVDADGGTFTVTCLGVTTAAVAATATATALKAALVAAGVPSTSVAVTGGPGNAGGATPYVFTYGGAQAGRNIAEITANGGSLTGGAGTATPGTTTAGGTAGTPLVLIDEHGNAGELPDNAIIDTFHIEPVTDFTTPGGTPTIKLGVNDAGLGDDIFKAATAYSNASYLVATQDLDGSSGLAKKVSETGGCAPIATVAAGALSAGKLHVHVAVRAGA